MFLIFDDGSSDSPFVERVWRCHSERAGRFLSVVSSHWEMVVTRYRDTTTLTVRGPETKVTPLDCPAEGSDAQQNVVPKCDSLQLARKSRLDGKLHEAAGICHAPRRRGSRLAARGACAARGDVTFPLSLLGRADEVIE